MKYSLCAFLQTGKFDPLEGNIIMRTQNWIAILDFGSQYSQLIARRIREQHVYSELLSFKITAEELAARRPSGIIFSGGPASVLDKESPLCDPRIYNLGIPILGINSNVVIGHGISNDIAIMNMIIQTRKVIQANLVDRIKSFFK